MSTWKQFWTLLKFQIQSWTSWIMMPLMLAIPIVVDSFHTPRTSNFSTDPLNFLLYVGVWAPWFLAPRLLGQKAVAVSFFTQTDFIFTRAIDRNIFYRARMVVFYLIVLTAPALMFFLSLRTSYLKVSFFGMDDASRVLQQQYLANIPGSFLGPGKYGDPAVFVPSSDLLLHLWNAGVFLLTALAVQFLILLTHSLKHQLFVYFAACLGIILVPILEALAQIYLTSNRESVPLVEKLFLAYLDHPILFIVLLASALVFGQLWCERRFARLEQ
jgi:hypothetical protein